MSGQGETKSYTARKMASPGKRCPTCGRREKRSTEANRRLWALYGVMSSKIRPQGKTYSPEQFHLYCRQRFLGSTDFDLPGGKTVTIPNSTAELDVNDFADYMTAVEALAAEHGAYLDE